MPLASIPALGVCLCASALAAIADAQSAPASSQFEVASIRPSAPGGRQGVWTNGSPNQIRMLGMSLKQLIGFAYDVEGYRVRAPGPIAAERYDVIARIPEDVAKLADDARWVRIHLMTQALLADRFQLRLHRETTEMAVYRLEIAKAGSKIRELGPNPGDNVIIDRKPGRLSAQRMPMSQLVSILRGELKRPVLDATGIRGVFDVSLDWSPARTDAGASADAAGSGPSLFTAVEEQLGLELEAGRSAVEVLVVDHAERASDN